MQSDVPTDVLGTSLVEVLLRRAADPRPAFTHHDHASGRAETVSWAEFVARVRVTAAALREVTRPGDRVAIAAAQEIAYPVAFCGALAAGAVAVPLMEPASRSLRARLAGVLADAQPRVVLTSRRAARRVFEAAAQSRILVVEDLDGPGAEPLPAGPEDPAYLQYTSGSTREPAGVVIPHRALVAACWQAARAYEVSERTACVGWIPFLHDMGLIQLLCLPVFTGCRSVFTAPLDFIRRPECWLRMMSGLPDVFTAAPNFAFDLAADAAPVPGLDLSGLRIALNGSEPVRPATITRFRETFACCGFRPEAHRPSYGLAEATVLVSATGSEGPVVTAFDREALHRGAAIESSDGQHLVSVGTPIGQRVRVVRDGKPLPPAEIGEVWVHGPNVATGYWARAGGGPGAFDACLDGRRGWLRTGDLGLVHENRLYLTGRLKDVMVVDGRNHHAEDVEATAGEAHPALRRGRLAAFGVGGETGEKVVVVAEWGAGADAAEVRRAVVLAVSRTHDLALHEVSLVEPGFLPRTSSGKVARAAARAAYRGSDV